MLASGARNTVTATGLPNVDSAGMSSSVGFVSVGVGSGNGDVGADMVSGVTLGDAYQSENAQSFAMGATGYTQASFSGDAIGSNGSIASAQQSQLFSVGAGGYQQSSSASLTIGPGGSVFSADQSQYVSVTPDGYSTGVEQRTDVGGGFVYADDFKAQDTVNSGGFTDQVQTKNEILGTGRETASQTVVNGNGIQADATTQYDCFGREVFGTSCGCQNGCFNCGLDLCGKDCNVNVCDPCIGCAKGLLCCGKAFCDLLSKVDCSKVGDCLSGTLSVIGDALKCVAGCFSKE